MYFVYILQIKKNGRYCIGQTQNVTKRLQKHSRGETRSLKNRGEFEVVYVERCSSRSEAIRLKKEVKSYGGGQTFERLLADFCEKKRLATT